jgi:hypothetical protein
MPNLRIIAFSLGAYEEEVRSMKHRNLIKPKFSLEWYEQRMRWTKKLRAMLEGGRYNLLSDQGHETLEVHIL